MFLEYRAMIDVIDLDLQVVKVTEVTMPGVEETMDLQKLNSVVDTVVVVVTMSIVM